MKLIFVSPDDNVHSRRWISELTKHNSYGNDLLLIDFYKNKFINFDYSAIIIGPLHLINDIESITQVPYFGLSWGYDFQNIDNVIQTSNLFRGYILDSLTNARKLIKYGIAPEMIFVLPWGVSYRHILSKKEITSKKFFNETKIKLLLPRNHEPIYNNGLIIDSLLGLKNISKYFITLTGQGSETEILIKKLQSSKLENNFVSLGKLDENEFINLLDKHDFLISASLIDGSSVTLLQAMARGLPVLVNKSENNMEWVTDNLTGYLFDANVMGDLSKRLQEAIKSDLATTVARANNKIHKYANWELNFDRLIAWMSSRLSIK